MPTISNITAKAWSDLLQQASKPVKKKGQDPIKQYLVLNTDPKSMEEHTIEVVTADQLKEGKYQKLSLSKITAVTEEILKKDKAKTPEIESSIATGIEQIIQAKDQRLKEVWHLRNNLRLFSRLLMAFLVGIFFGWLVKVELDATKVDFGALKKEINSAYQFIDRLREAAYFNGVDALIRQENDSPHDPIAQEIKAKMIGSEYTPEQLFKLDHNRNVFFMKIKKAGATYSFYRIAHEKAPETTREKSSEELIEKFKTIVGNKEDPKWIEFLESVFTQQTATAVFRNLKMYSSLLLDPDSPDRYELEPVGATHFEVTFVGAEKIEKLEVQASTMTAFFHKNSSSAFLETKESERVPGKTIKSELHFEITLNTEKKPDVTVTQYHHEWVKADSRPVGVEGAQT